jgi:hypothetical protein
VISKVGKILKYSVFAMLRIAVALFLLMQTSSFQTYITQFVATIMSNDLGTTVTIDHVDIDWFHTMTFENLYIEDLHHDTLLFVPELTAEISDWGIDSQFFDFSSIALIEPRINLKKYEGEQELNLKFVLDYFSSDEPKDTTKRKWKFSSDAVTMTGAHLTLHDQNNTSTTKGMNFKDLDMTHLRFTLTEFELDGDTIQSRFDQLGFIDQCGLRMDTLNGMLTVSPGGVQLKDALIKTNRTTIRGEIGFETESYASFGNFIQEVRLRNKFVNTEIELADLAYFVPALQGIQRKVVIREGKFRGFVNALKGKNVDMKFDENTEFIGSFDLTGLPNIEETFISLNIKKFKTNYEDLERIPLPPFTENKTLDLPHHLANLGTVNLKGRFDGFVNDFVAESQIHTSIGKIATNFTLRYDTAIDDYRYSGDLFTSGLAIGTLLQNDEFGTLSSELDLRGSGFDPDQIRANLKGSINEFDFKGYRYHGVAVNADVRSQLFSGVLAIQDDNLDLRFDGKIDFTKRVPVMNFVADLKKGYLAKLNLIEGDSSFNFTTLLDINLEGDDPDNLEGTMVASGTQLLQLGELYDFKKIKIKSSSSVDGRSVVFDSEFLYADLRGMFNFEHMGTSALSIAASIVPSLFKDEVYLADELQNFEYQLVFKEFSPVTRLFMPQLEVSDYSTINGSYNSWENEFQINADGGRIKFGDQVYHDFFLDVENSFEVLLMQIGVGKLDLKDTVGTVHFDDVQLRSYVYQDVMPINLTWHNTDSTNWGKINGNAYIEATSKFEFDMKESVLHYRDLEWTIDEKCAVFIDSTTIEIKDFAAYMYDQVIEVEGKISQDSTEHLNFETSNFDLTNINPFIESSGMRLYGLFTDTGYVANMYQDMYFETVGIIELFGLNDEMIGDVKIDAEYDKVKEGIYLSGHVLRDEMKTIEYAGYYYPKRKDDNIDLGITLENQELRPVNAVLPPGSAELDGLVNGEIDLTGSTDSLLLNGHIDFSNSSAELAYTNVKYTFNGRVEISPDMIAMDYLPIRDTRGGNGYVIGTLYHNNFEEMNFDVSVVLQSLMCLNTTAQMNESYYGTAIGSGDASVSGYQDNLKIEANITTEKGTAIDLPLSGSTEVTASDFITFKPIDGSEAVPDSVDLSGIDMVFNIKATEDASMRVIFDEAVGDIMQGRGIGDIKMQITPAGELKMTGEFEVREGDYLFTLQNIISKKFTVVPGGTVSWYGDPYEAVLNLQTQYEVRTTLYDLFMEENDAYKKRIPVYVLMNISDKMLTPDIKFGLNVPSVDQTTRALLESTVSGEQDLNRQVFALLLLNKFLPANGEGGGGGVASSSSSELLSNQLTNWVNKLSSRLDLGVNYRAGDDVTGDELAVAMSTAIFDDRITISTNLGVSGAGGDASQSTSGLIGDFAIEYKITEDGRLKMRAFNESNDGTLEANQSPYTQGVGVFYREEFDSAQQIYYLQAMLNPFRSKNNVKKQHFIENKNKRRTRKKKQQDDHKRKKDALKARYDELMEQTEEHRKATEANPE